MGTRLYVGNLPFSADESAVRSLFEQNERTVEEVKLITDRDTGRPRGFGFVEMGSNEDADKAIRELDGYQMDGRALKVQLKALDGSRRVERFLRIQPGSREVIKW